MDPNGIVTTLEIQLHIDKWQDQVEMIGCCLGNHYNIRICSYFITENQTELYLCNE